MAIGRSASANAAIDASERRRPSIVSSGVKTNASVAAAEKPPRIIADRESVKVSAKKSADATAPRFAAKIAGDGVCVSASAAAPKGNRAYSKAARWLWLAKKPTAVPALVKVKK